MKSILILGSVFASAMAFADTATYDVSGMHCGGCKKTIEASVCGKIEGQVSCSVELIDAKKQTGKLTLVTAEGKKIEDKKISEMVAAAGEYKISRVAEKSTQPVKK